MKQVWRVYRVSCVILVSAAAIVTASIFGLGTFTGMTAAPAARAPSPDGALEVRVFTAGQGAVPPDYRAGVRFYLYDRSGWPLFRYTLIAAADFADGWSVDWTGPREATIRAGRLSWFDAAKTEAGGVAVRLLVADRSPEEARCIEQSFADAIDGVVCFDALIGLRDKPQ